MMAPPPAVVAVSVRFHHWRLGFRQSSFHHIARVLQGATLHAFRWPLLLRHALVPSGFRLQVNRMTQKSPFELLLTASGIQHRVPRRTLSPHTSQHSQIRLGLSSVAWCAYRLNVIHSISLGEILEPCARYHVIYFYLGGMERFSFAFAHVRHVECTDCSFEKNDFFSQVAFSLPVFIAVPDVVIGG